MPLFLSRCAFALSVLGTLASCASAQGEPAGASSIKHAANQEAGEPAPETLEGPAPQIAQYPSAPHQDLAGNLWFRSAFAGLIRFDGSQFKTFTTDDGLPSNMTRGVHEDPDGTLWFATSGGLVQFDGERFTTLTDYKGTSFTKGFSPHGLHRDIWDVMRDRQGVLWIATMGGVFRHNGKAFEAFEMPGLAPQHAFEFTPSMVYSIYEDKRGNLWFGTDGAGVVRFDGTTKAVYTRASHGLASDRVCEILEDSRGDFWFGTSDGGVSRFDGKRFTTHLRAEEPTESMGWGRVMAIHEDFAGDVWFSGAGPIKGVHRYDGTRFQHYFETQGLGGGHAASIRKDRHGNLWFGTTAGVHFFDGERFVICPKDAKLTAAIMKQSEAVAKARASEVDVP